MGCNCKNKLGITTNSKGIIIRNNMIKEEPIVEETPVTLESVVTNINTENLTGDTLVLSGETITSVTT